MSTTITATQLHPLFLQDDVKGLVFDLDGTLIDSAADIIGGLREAFLACGYGQVPADYLPDNLHGTSEGIMRSIMADMGWSPPADFDALRQAYQQVYAQRGHANTQLYAGAAQVLHQCAGRFVLGICTNKVHRNAMAVTDTLGIQSHFAVISGADSWGQAKPSPVPLLQTIHHMGLHPEQCLYFGDTSVDAECAASAGVRFVLHASGYGDAALKGHEHFHAFADWGELLGA